MQSKDKFLVSNKEINDDTFTMIADVQYLILHNVMLHSSYFWCNNSAHPQRNVEKAWVYHPTLYTRSHPDLNT